MSEFIINEFISNKNSKSVVFSYSTYLNSYIFYTYQEVIRKKKELPMSYTKFVENSEKIPTSYIDINKIIISQPKKKKYLFF